MSAPSYTLSVIGNLLPQGVRWAQEKPRISKESALQAGDVSSLVLPSTLHPNGTNPLPAYLHPEVSVSLPDPPPNPAGGIGSDNSGAGIIDEGEELSLAQHWPRRQNQQLPLRFRDVLPQPPLTAPLELDDELPQYVGHVVNAAAQPALPCTNISPQDLHLMIQKNM
ncbi:hypothetical protein DFJ58DRAFT_847894 [Suillus subalutaceus]|uniref:uncharacterized protein n=1 Tax=Suillus subalutaceus TaxID=48586 RepID=UPI001B87D000|nr:uncharacterized protein DFJ58DRAFT_847894 [Suillus subalutaceus]KAG1833198.1 hypothetical protein DFJ58DRAFT_847894 [Suillus subalutaceus]